MFFYPPRQTMAEGRRPTGRITPPGGKQAAFYHQVNRIVVLKFNIFKYKSLGAHISLVNDHYVGAIEFGPDPLAVTHFRN